MSRTVPGSLTSVTADLKPERCYNYEVGAKWEILDGLLATAALYQLDRSNTRATDPNDRCCTSCGLLPAPTNCPGDNLDTCNDPVDDQSNLVHVTVREKVKSLRLSRDTPSDKLTFDTR